MCSNTSTVAGRQPIPIFPYFPIFFIFSYISETFLYSYNCPIFYIFPIFLKNVIEDVLCSILPPDIVYLQLCVNISVCVYAQLQEGKVLLRPRVLVLLNGQRWKMNITVQV